MTYHADGTFHDDDTIVTESWIATQKWDDTQKARALAILDRRTRLHNTITRKALKELIT